MSRADAAPDPTTTWVRVADRSHATHRRIASLSWVSVIDRSRQDRADGRLEGCLGDAVEVCLDLAARHDEGASPS